MTKTQATKVARDRLAHGYFRVDASTARVTYSGHDVLLYGIMGRQASHGEMVRQLAHAIQEIEAGDWEAIEA